MAGGQSVFVEGAGYYRVMGVHVGSPSADLKNLGTDVNAPYPTIIAAGAQVTPAGESGTGVAGDSGLPAANVFFVDCNAESEGSGSISSPFKTIGAAVAAGATDTALTLFLIPPLESAPSNYADESPITINNAGQLISIVAFGASARGRELSIAGYPLIALPALTVTGSPVPALRVVGCELAAVTTSDITVIEDCSITAEIHSGQGAIYLRRCQVQGLIHAGTAVYAEDCDFTINGEIVKSEIQTAPIRLERCTFSSGGNAVRITFLDDEGSGDAQFDAITNQNWKALTTPGINFGAKSILGDLAA
jgi:hypothetical protein